MKTQAKSTKKIVRECRHCSGTGKVWSGGMWVPCDTENDCGLINPSGIPAVKSKHKHTPREQIKDIIIMWDEAKEDLEDPVYFKDCQEKELDEIMEAFQEAMMSCLPKKKVKRHVHMPGSFVKIV